MSKISSNIVTVSKRGRILIPAHLRQKYSFHPTAQIQFVDYGGIVTLIPKLLDPIRQAAGMLKGRTSLTGALTVERKIEKRRG
jgi:bifunctional DNA-binding transcriptional regulator/antitoxin component of YhaV-PrlF toxin-antitoxin module